MDMCNPCHFSTPPMALKSPDFGYISPSCACHAILASCFPFSELCCLLRGPLSWQPHTIMTSSSRERALACGEAWACRLHCHPNCQPTRGQHIFLRFFEDFGDLILLLPTLSHLCDASYTRDGHMRPLHTKVFELESNFDLYDCVFQTI
jgi:hypothetical protein